MQTAQKILLLKIFRNLALLIGGVCAGLLILDLSATHHGFYPQHYVVLALVVIAFFSRRWCVRQLDRFHKESSEADHQAAGQTARVGWFVTIGFLAGALIAFLLRPSGAVVGQLPIGVVVTRGVTLSGLDQLLIPLAETSFNYMLAGGVIGVLIGFAASKFPGKK